MLAQYFQCLVEAKVPELNLISRLCCAFVSASFLTAAKRRGSFTLSHT